MKSALAGALAAGALFAGIVDGHPLSKFTLRIKVCGLLTLSSELKRDLVTELVYTTVTVANVIVWVDENGVPYDTTTVDLATTIATTVMDASVTTSTIDVVTPSSALPSLVITPAAVATSKSIDFPAVVAPSSSVAAEPSVAPSPSPTPAPASSSQAPPPPPPPAPSSEAPPPPPLAPTPEKPVVATPSSPPKAASNDRFPVGVTYDPFKVGGCKTEEEITNEMNNMKDFGIIRIYGMGCNIIPLTVKAAKANNQKIMAGVYRSADPNNNENIETVVSVLSNAIKQYAGGDWSIISVVSVENEKVNSKQMTVSDVIDAIRNARDALRSAGYDGPVGAVETAPATIDNPSICAESDLAMVNIHAFFDTHTSAKDAGSFVQGQVDMVKKACPNKRVIITESGWPHQGDSHDNAVASPEAQKTAMDSIRAQFNGDVFLFNAFDSYWKTDDAYTHNAEKYWGIL
jgi:exo-beta-1,3-glucanase (GH17 family)